MQLEPQQFYQAVEKSLADGQFAPIYFFHGEELARMRGEESTDGRLRVPRVGDFEEGPAAPRGGVVHGGHPQLFRGIDFGGFVAVFRAGDGEVEAVVFHVGEDFVEVVFENVRHLLLP